MADNSGSNAVAIVAIVIIVFLAIGGYYFFVNRDATSTNVAVDMPSVSAPSTDAGSSTTSTTTTN